MEVGKELRVGEESILRVNLKLGLQKYLDGSETDVRAQLAGAPAGIDPLTVGANLGDPLYSSGIGIELFNRDNLLIQLNFGRNYYDHSGIGTTSLKFQIPLH